MKKIIISVVAILLVGLVGLGFCFKKQTTQEDYLRVHIRANSNLECDQNVKYEVKKAVVDYLTPLVASGNNFKEVYSILEDNLSGIEEVADKVLKENGFDYTSSASLNNEYFPTRSYESVTLENGYYDALILNLGSGQGNNWWCVVYPPLCFIGGQQNGTTNIKYKSKLVEMVRKFFNK